MNLVFLEKINELHFVSSEELKKISQLENGFQYQRSSPDTKIMLKINTRSAAICFSSPGK
jgi:hypothetical protein